MNRKVIVAGHICLDITPQFPEKKQKDISKLMIPGTLIQMGDADVHTGGAVANTGLAMKLLGVDVALMGKVGTDAFGDMICNILQRYNAADGMLREEGESTSYSVVLAIPGIDRIFLHNPGANNTFCAKDIPQEALEKAALMHFGYPPLMRTMYEKEGDELLGLFQRAKSCGCATSLDMAAVDGDSEAGQVNWDGILQRLMPLVDFFVPSVEELCFMLDAPTYAKWQERAAGGDIIDILDIERDVRPLADKCMAYGAKVLLIKCGALGMYYRTNGAEVLSGIGEELGLDVEVWKDKQGFETSFVPEKILSGTGAGDTSIAAFLTAMLKGCPPKQCVQLAAAMGAACVESYDALGGLKSLEELQARIDAGWKKKR